MTQSYVVCAKQQYIEVWVINFAFLEKLQSTEFYVHALILYWSNSSVDGWNLILAGYGAGIKVVAKILLMIVVIMVANYDGID